MEAAHQLVVAVGVVVKPRLQLLPVVAGPGNEAARQVVLFARDPALVSHVPRVHLVEDFKYVELVVITVVVVGVHVHHVQADQRLQEVHGEGVVRAERPHLVLFP